MNSVSLRWATPILATLTAVLDAGHLAHLFDAEVLVLISAIVTAAVGFFAAIKQRSEEMESVKAPQPMPTKAK